MKNIAPILSAIILSATCVVGYTLAIEGLVGPANFNHTPSLELKGV